jgi:hypothetical protein
VSLVAVLVVAGVPSGIASAVAMVLAVALLSVAWRLARGPLGDRRAFALAIVAALISTPIVWEHYMVLLFVPVALASPRLSRLWLVPLVSPVVTVVSRAFIPDARHLTPDSPDALRGALLWLTLQAIVAVGLCTTAEQRRVFGQRQRRQLRQLLRLRRGRGAQPPARASL